jgi:hypothetical protein
VIHRCDYAGSSRVIGCLGSPCAIKNKALDGCDKQIALNGPTSSEKIDSMSQPKQNFKAFSWLDILKAHWDYWLPYLSSILYFFINLG